MFTVIKLKSAMEVLLTQPKMLSIEMDRTIGINGINGLQFVYISDSLNSAPVVYE